MAIADVAGRLTCLVLALALAPACGNPLVMDSVVYPAQILTVIDAPRVQDGRARFREIFCELAEGELSAGEEATEPFRCESYLTRLVDEDEPDGELEPWPSDASLHVVIVPGLFNECLPEALPFADAAERLREQGYRVSTLIVGGRSGPAFNARAMADAIDKLWAEDRQRLLLVGHSKGTVDSMQFLRDYPELADRVAALVSVAGAVNGSPLAGRLAPFYAEFLADLPIDECDEGDGRAVESLKPSLRMNWLANNPLPPSVRYFSVVAYTDRPNVSPGLVDTYAMLAKLDPRNDGQLLAFDQFIPGATLLGYANADHWRVVIPPDRPPSYLRPFVADDPFPREALLEAIVAYVTEALREESPVAR